MRLRPGERVFVMWSGLKGAVPILLGTYILTAGVAGAAALYEIIVVVVAFSVIVQGGLVPALARRTGVPMRTVEPEPWAWACGSGTSPRACTASPSPPATAPTAARSPTCPRRGRLDQLHHPRREPCPRHGSTVLQAGDEILILASGADAASLTAAFTQPGPRGKGKPRQDRP